MVEGTQDIFGPEFILETKMKAFISLVCPRCGDDWYNNLDESGTPYTCYFCCNGTLTITQEMVEEDNGRPDFTSPEFIAEVNKIAAKEVKFARQVLRDLAKGK